MFGSRSGRNFLANTRLRQGKEESASFAEFGFDPDDAGIQLDNLFDNRKADAGAVDPILRRKGLEYLEDLLKVLLINSGSVIGNAEFQKAVLLDTADFDLSFGLIHILNGIAQQVLEYLYDLCFLTH